MSSVCASDPYMIWQNIQKHLACRNSWWLGSLAPWGSFFVTLSGGWNMWMPRRPEISGNEIWALNRLQCDFQVGIYTYCAEPLQVMVVAILLLLWSRNVPTLTEAGGALESMCAYMTRAILSIQNVVQENCIYEGCEKINLLLSPHENIDDGWNCLIENKCCLSYTIYYRLFLFVPNYVNTFLLVPQSTLQNVHD